MLISLKVKNFKFKRRGNETGTELKKLLGEGIREAYKGRMSEAKNDEWIKILLNLAEKVMAMKAVRLGQKQF